MNQDHIDLINKVRNIDSEAADYLENDAKALDIFVESDELASCFFWHKSPQGFHYWNNISEQLGEWEYE